MFGEKALELIRELHRNRDGALGPYNEECVRQVLEEMQVLYESNQQDVSQLVQNDSDQTSLTAIQIRHDSLQRNKRCLLAYLYNRLFKIRTMRWEFGSVLPAEIKGNMSEKEMGESYVWYGYVQRMGAVAWPKKIHGNNSRGRPQKRWVDNIREDFVLVDSENRVAWRNAITQSTFDGVPNPRSAGMDRFLSQNYTVQWFTRYNRSLANYMRSFGNGGLDLTQDLQPPQTVYIEVRCVEDRGELELDDGTRVLLKKNSLHFLPRSQCEHLIRQGILQHVT